MQHRALTETYERLGYAGQPGFITASSATAHPFERYIWNQANAKLGAEAVFLGAADSGQVFPLIYFCALDSAASGEIARIHRLAWNASAAPLLFLILPDEIRIYSSFCPGDTREKRWDPDKALLDRLQLSVLAGRFASVAEHYQRERVLSGALWQERPLSFRPEGKVDRMLLDNLRSLREALSARGLPHTISHALIIRTIFVKYLEGRRDRDTSVFPPGFLNQFLPTATSFKDLLVDKHATYRFFDDLADRLNGNVLPVSNEEREVVRTDHLRLLRDFLTGEADLATGQLAFWPFYSFDVIPTQLISSIYEQFLQEAGDPRMTGAYYTPPMIVNFLMDQVLPWSVNPTRPRVLDPACGSGAFLVEAYRRIIESHRHNGDEKLSASTLKGLLLECIHGVDLSAEAIRVAAFSLYLTLCDYLEPRHIWQQVKFPQIAGSNLISGDYFEVKYSKPFDIVVGNPPWASRLTEGARTYMENRELPLGDKQLAQAFMWKALSDCSADGRVALLVPSKGFAFNRSRPNREFRKRFLDAAVLHSAANFSLMAFTLFEHAITPATGVVYSPAAAPPHEHRVVYCTPKPTGSVEESWRVPIQTSDIAEIPQHELQARDVLWKVAMWGGPRDYQLVKRLLQLQTLGQFIYSRGWVAGEGYIRGGFPQVRALQYLGWPHIDTSGLRRFRIVEHDLPANRQDSFHRPRMDSRIYRGPHLVIRQSPEAPTGMVAAVIDRDALFSHSFMGVHVPTARDIPLLNTICLILCSRLATYFMMLTARRWLGVERGELEKDEVLGLPLPKTIAGLMTTTEELDRLARLPDGDRAIAEIDNVVSDWYELTQAERSLVDDMVTYEWGYFKRRSRSRGFQPVTPAALGDYLKMLSTVLMQSFSRDFKCRGRIDDDLRLSIVSVTPSDVTAIDVSTPDAGARDSLRSLDHSLSRRGLTTSVFSQRTVTIYENETIYIVKPAVLYHWTTSRAMRDADKIYEDVMTSWGG